MNAPRERRQHRPIQFRVADSSANCADSSRPCSAEDFTAKTQRSRRISFFFCLLCVPRTEMQFRGGGKTFSCHLHPKSQQIFRYDKEIVCENCRWLFSSQP